MISDVELTTKVTSWHVMTATLTRAAPLRAATPKTPISASNCARQNDSHLMSPAPPHDVADQPNPETPPSREDRHVCVVPRPALCFES